ncbi:DNA helicase MCM9-like [Copidosoma floridanum]|uniref:DNA helicase MCM9-like n=1 Tax=Copidosoma floridanum TaxID=29053 RepID=UPI000C6F6BBC|nr:DNA helicase MCM9-like [Copidosoma floridanum]
MLKEYFLLYHENELREILKDPDETRVFSINVDFIIIFEHDAKTALKILRLPRQCLPACDQSAIEAQEQLAEFEQKVKKNIRTRVYGVPENIDQAEIGELVSVTGFVVRITQPSVSIVEKHLLCKKCNYVNILKLEWEKGKFPDTRECGACKRKSLHPETSLQTQICADYQEIKIQDKTSNVSSTMTSALPVVLLDDLVDKCTSGDNVNICGFLIRKWDKVVVGQRPLSTTFLLASSLLVRRKVADSDFCKEEVTKIFRNFWDKYGDRPLEGRDFILTSVCPQLYGMYSLKLALAVILCGGVSKTTKSGTRVRGDSHLLLCGDPGTGKSQILRTAARLAARSILTTGVGTTAAGLTAAAIKDSDGWHLEAGALVSANGGVCCIDELTTMSNNDMASIHEAMEQQTISIAKAGLVSTLNSRCTVIAAINPVGGRFVDGEEVKMRLGGPLLSRFDIILFLRDNHDPQWDELVSNHILQAAMVNNNYESQLSLKNTTDYSMIENANKSHSVFNPATKNKNLQVRFEDATDPSEFESELNKTPSRKRSAPEDVDDFSEFEDEPNETPPCKRPAPDNVDNFSEFEDEPNKTLPLEKSASENVEDFCEFEDEPNETPPCKRPAPDNVDNFSEFEDEPNKTLPLEKSASENVEDFCEFKDEPNGST